MARQLTSQELRCVAHQRDHAASLNSAAQVAERIVNSELRVLGVAIHAVSARAKTAESLREKLRGKAYPHPDQDVSDLVGVRVIAYYPTDVDAIAQQLMRNLDIDKSRSIDKRPLDASDKFGYRSVHLVARLRTDRAKLAENAALAGMWFEIQIRTILEHAWAEIEHDVVYKASVDYPPHERRRFASIAGALEILDREFLALRHVRTSLTNGYLREYQRGKRMSEAFDSARMVAFFERLRPQATGWRSKNGPASALPANSEVCCLHALRAVGLDVPRKLTRVIENPRCQ